MGFLVFGGFGMNGSCLFDVAAGLSRRQCKHIEKKAKNRNKNKDSCKHFALSRVKKNSTSQFLLCCAQFRATKYSLFSFSPTPKLDHREPLSFLGSPNESLLLVTQRSLHVLAIRHRQIIALITLANDALR
jgi:hypothetical protein